MHLKAFLPALPGACLAVLLLLGFSAPACAQAEMPPLPGWLQAQIGTGEGQIAPVVLQRARALYYQKLGSGEIRNGCYFAMDATRPSGVGKHGRFYIICEGDRVYRVMSSGHGNGRNLPGVANFANGRDCAKHFSNAEDSLLTAGGSYVTAELKPSFKGYFRENGQYRALIRTFIQFDGMGETANARPRQIGGHPSVIIRAQCRMKAPGNEYADKNGYVPYGTFINYTGGRSNGCTSWSWSDAKQINAMVKDNPTSLYIYPESRDIVAVGRGVPGAYWNAACKRAIGTPKFWPRETLAPAIAQYKKAHPSPPAKPLPICK